MRCPKCSHVQRNLVECESCGIIFAKYRKFQEKKKEDDDRQALAAEARKRKIWMTAAIVSVLALGAGAYLSLRSRSGPVDTPQLARIEPQPDQTAAPPSPVYSTPVEQVEPADSEPETVNTIEKARNATVSIEAPWGTGSGFFVNRHYLVTNRHVVEFDEKKLAEFRDKVETGRRLISLEMEKIEQLRQQMFQLPPGPTRSQLEILIEARIDEVNKILPQQQQGEERLARLEEKLDPSDIKIVLADGREFAANYLLVSDTHDLALMSLFSGEYDFIDRAPEDVRLRQGDTVYTIGSPVGLRHTVTSGVFSGYRQRPESEEVFLQTDAPINPGNSGGPLIDAHGYARGVNTMILRGTEGIGFAIPIEVVFEEFRSVLF